VSEATTRNVRVRVVPKYQPSHSDPGRSFWFFSYTVEIENIGGKPFQLKSRHWIITDGTGTVEHVRGPGVVGYTPRLASGERFEYTSACPLGTSMGSMEGTFQMVTDEGEEFDAEIEVFSLYDPMSMN
jgi:ApaG protein